MQNILSFFYDGSKFRVTLMAERIRLKLNFSTVSGQNRFIQKERQKKRRLRSQIYSTQKYNQTWHTRVPNLAIKNIENYFVIVFAEIFQFGTTSTISVFTKFRTVLSRL